MSRLPVVVIVTMIGCLVIMVSVHCHLVLSEYNQVVVVWAEGCSNRSGRIASGTIPEGTQ